MYMDELTMKGLAASEDLFSHHNKGKATPPSPIIMRNGTSSPSDLSVKPLDLKSCSSDMSSNQSPSPPVSLTRGTWHDHQYSKPSSIPTPFTIKDILGLSNEDASFKEEAAPSESSPLSPTPTTPSPQPLSMELDEPLNLTVRKRENPDSPSNEENNNNGLANGIGRLFPVNHLISGDKSSSSPLLPNDVIIPKVKRPKISSAVALKNGSAKAKACGAINLKTNGKRKSKYTSGSTSTKVLVIDTSTSSRVNTPDTDASVPIPGPAGGSLSPGSSNDSKKRKKARTTFTGKQIYELERQFEIKKYLSSSERSEMARLLNVTEVQVKIWFQNRRTKWKKQDHISNAEAAEHKVHAGKSKKERNSHKGQARRESSKSKASGSDGRLPGTGTSECSLSMSGSMDSSDDHSNGSLLTDGNISEGGGGGVHEQVENTGSVAKIPETSDNLSLNPGTSLSNNHSAAPSTATVPCKNSVLISQLSSGPSSPGSLLSSQLSLPTEKVTSGRIVRVPILSPTLLLPATTKKHVESQKKVVPKSVEEESSLTIATTSNDVVMDGKEEDKGTSELSPGHSAKPSAPIELSSNPVVSICSSLEDKVKCSLKEEGDDVIPGNKSLDNQTPTSPVS